MNKLVRLSFVAMLLIAASATLSFAGAWTARASGSRSLVMGEGCLEIPARRDGTKRMGGSARHTGAEKKMAPVPGFGETLEAYPLTVLVARVGGCEQPPSGP